MPLPSRDLEGITHLVVVGTDCSCPCSAFTRRLGNRGDARQVGWPATESGDAVRGSGSALTVLLDRESGLAEELLGIRGSAGSVLAIEAAAGMGKPGCYRKSARERGSE